MQIVKRIGKAIDIYTHMVAEDRSRRKVRTLVNLVTTQNGLNLHRQWICNKCSEAYPSYEALRLHKKDKHAY